MPFLPSPTLLPIPHIPQQASGECLAACAAMALNYSGYKINCRRLVQILQIRPGYGTPFPKIQTLTSIGIKVTYQQGNQEELYRFLSQNKPCIVPVQTDQLPYWNQISVGHAVVVVGMDRDSVYLNDPEFPKAPIQVPYGDFDLAWFELGEVFTILEP
jgi:ABC-type bacteriocin/lantibiotic exporter with double-glycine peptidase domain